MEVTNSGKLYDPEILQGRKIVEIIYAVIYKEYKPARRSFPGEKFPGDAYFAMAIGIFIQVKFLNPTVSEISDYIYGLESKDTAVRGSRKRCNRIAQCIMLLQPFISDHIAWEKDRLLLRHDYVSPD